MNARTRVWLDRARLKTPSDRVGAMPAYARLFTAWYSTGEWLIACSRDRAHALHFLNLPKGYYGTDLKPIDDLGAYPRMHRLFKVSAFDTKFVHIRVADLPMGADKHLRYADPVTGELVKGTQQLVMLPNGTKVQKRYLLAALDGDKVFDASLTSHGTLQITSLRSNRFAVIQTIIGDK